MTSVRSFSEILMTEKGLSEDERDRFVSIIHDESRRLTRLLDELLDISRWKREPRPSTWGRSMPARRSMRRLPPSTA